MTANCEQCRHQYSAPCTELVKQKAKARPEPCPDETPIKKRGDVNK